MKIFKKLYIVFILLVLLCCKKAFNPNVTATNYNYLVVEGIINTGADSTFIRLSRTVLLDSKTTLKVESGATVTVESDASQVYRLVEKPLGTYAAAPLNLDNTRKYRVRIVTKGSTYLSDFVESKVSPQIDSLNYKVAETGLQIYANTHDASNKTRYYRWEYNETWQFNAKYFSAFKADGKGIVSRDMNTENIFSCWGNSISSSIVLGSSLKLVNDVIFQNPVTLVPSDSEKIGIKYSILVKQYALTKDAFEFWELLKKNTENLGSIFDAQPSQLTGNIRNISNAAEPVIGYISAGTVTQKRIYVTKDRLPNWRLTYPFSCSEPDTVFTKDGDMLFQSKVLIPLDQVANDSGVIIGHTGAGSGCSDCTIRGTNKKPAFWQ
ncbi:DUF4249 domain-containing protein [Pedobacter aquatilis]|uniref:DUF4249 domain-containing protein n=1 Tax=Pedobacter aquatilis TaxID=351343 RepID=UPI00292CD5BC|nr:DUF4249 domain-containing protein [Pedobacter aquatilis]